MRTPFRHSIVPALSFIVFSGFLSACDADDQSVNTQITEVTWHLTTINGTDASTGTDVNSVDLILSESDGTAGGFSGCNRYTTAFELSGEELSFGLIAGTRMFCEGNMDLESSYLAALEKVERLASSDEYLHLLDASGSVILAFSRSE